jgi:PAS domain S-box-containing protein
MITERPRANGQLLTENESLRKRLEEAEQTVEAIRNGEVDAVVVCGPPRDAVYSLEGADRPYQLLIEAMQQGAATVNQEGTILYCNRFFAELLKTPLERVIGASLENFLADSDRPILVGVLGEVPGQARVRLECRLRRGDGIFFPAELVLHWLPFKQSLCVILDDLSEQKQYKELLETKQRLAQSESRFRNLVFALPAAVYTTDREGRITLFNDQAAALWGRRPDLGKDLWCGSWRIFQPDGTPLPHDQCPMAAALHEGRSVRGQEIVVERPDGTRVCVLPYPEPLRDASGEILGAVNMLVDITDRKRAEEARSRLAAIVESSDDAIVTKSLDGTITSWNKGAERMFGYSAEEIVGRPITMLAAPGSLDDPLGILERIRRGERVEHYETLRRTKDGRSLFVSLAVSPVRDAAGRIIGASKIARDITEHKRLEEALRDRTRQLAEADRRKDEFLAMLGHELRNPLGPIRNAVQILRLRGPAEPVLQQSRDIIERQATHMARLIDDLLDVSRIAHGKVLLRKEVLDLVEVVRVTAMDYRSSLEATGLTLDLQLPDEPLWVKGDSTRLAQVVGNVLHNASKFTDPGGCVTVRVTQADSGDTAVIAVRDTGIGMDRKTLAQVFETFRQAENSQARSRGGLGLGLALVKGLVDLHDGSVQATSEGLGRGSEITIRLPKERTPELPKQAGRAPSLAERTHRILVIEDNRDAAESMKILLGLVGHQVETASTGAAGVETARTFQPQVVLCDIGLPGEMDGYAVARALRQEPALASAHLIALTGYAQEDDQRCAREAGFNRHMTKPVDFAELQAMLASLPVQRR